MGNTARVIAMAVLLAAVYGTAVLGQNRPAAILTLDVENLVNYDEDLSPPSKFATDPNPSPDVLPANFNRFTLIGDIVAVNGQPVKGTVTSSQLTMRLTTAFTPGQAIADTVREGIQVRSFEILKLDGTPVGTIFASGLSAGAPPPGAPLSVIAQNEAIVGGTGAFLGAVGQFGNAVPLVGRRVSISEDPAYRRINGGGGTSRYVLHIIPMFRPEVTLTQGVPAVTHSTDFSLVTSSKPAAAGEILSMFMTGLGPTKPGVDPGQPFPASPAAVVVNSPVEVTVNGKSAEVLAAVGFPGTVDGYQVNFRVPSDTAKGTATIQVSAAWIPGPPVSITVQ